MADYTHLYREELRKGVPWDYNWDLFISAYNESERVSAAYSNVVATEKHWLFHNEYSCPLPAEGAFCSSAPNEGEYIVQYFQEKLGGADLNSTSICVDATGFMRPHLMFLMRYLFNLGVRRIDFIYSEPKYYKQKEDTKFSNEQVIEVRQVVGFEGVTNNDTSSDLLIIGAGYETHLIKEVAEDKEKAKKIVLLGFPSLTADMYQQNAWRTRLAADAIGEISYEKYFAPANDPFVTATKLSEIISRENEARPITNIYLSPLATKAQAIGFALFYYCECLSKNVSIIFPFSSSYSSDTSEGVGRTWRFTIEV